MLGCVLFQMYSDARISGIYTLRHQSVISGVLVVAETYCNISICNIKPGLIDIIYIDISVLYIEPPNREITVLVVAETYCNIKPGFE